ncbi:MAG TPA: ABC transporter permease [Acidimicrobiales bacterium]|nr:ABC transporter permease [Acidimicrobiales bacterium]
MRPAVLVAVTELRRRMRDRTVLIHGFLAPVVLGGIIGLAVGRQGGRVTLAASTGEHAPAAAVAAVTELVASTSRDANIAVRRYASATAARDAVRRGRAQAAVLVGEREGGEPVQVVDRPGEELGASMARAVAATVRERIDTGRVVAAALGGAAPSPALPGSSPAITLTSRRADQRVRLIAYYAPSVAVIFLFFGAGAAGRSLLQERREGTLLRLRAAPVTSASVVAGKIAAVFVLSLTSIFVLWGTTSLVFSTSWGSPAAVALVCVAVAAAISGVGLMVAVRSRDEREANGSLAVVGFALALLGGNFFPPGSLPTALAWASLLTPNGWATQAFGRLAIDGTGLDSVRWTLVALGGMAVTFAALAWSSIDRALAL